MCAVDDVEMHEAEMIASSIAKPVSLDQSIVSIARSDRFFNTSGNVRVILEERKRLSIE